MSDNQMQQQTLTKWIGVQLNHMRPQLQAILPATMTVERFIAVVSRAIYQNPKIQQCDPASVLAAIREAAELGLEPTGGVMAQGDLIPVWSAKHKRMECQFRPRYTGLIELVRNTGEITSVFAEVVYEGEEFQVWIEDGKQRIWHKPDFMRSRQDSNIVCAYACATLKNGEFCIAIMPREDIERARMSSETEKARAAGKLQSQTVWEQWYGEMAKKTVLKRLCKMLPRDRRVARAIELDQADYEQPAPVEPISAATAEKTAKLRERLQVVKQGLEAELEPNDSQTAQDPAPEDFDDAR